MTMLFPGLVTAHRSSQPDTQDPTPPPQHCWVCLGVTGEWVRESVPRQRTTMCSCGGKDKPRCAWELKEGQGRPVPAWGGQCAHVHLAACTQVSVCVSLQDCWPRYVPVCAGLCIPVWGRVHAHACLCVAICGVHVERRSGLWCAAG